MLPLSPTASLSSRLRILAALTARCKKSGQVLVRSSGAFQPGALSPIDHCRNSRYDAARYESGHINVRSHAPVFAAKARASLRIRKTPSRQKPLPLAPRQGAQSSTTLIGIGWPVWNNRHAQPRTMITCRSGWSRGRLQTENVHHSCNSGIYRCLVILSHASDITISECV